MTFKSSASPGSYSQVIDGSVAFSKTRKLQDANQTRAQQRQRHTKLLADRNRDNLNSLKAAQGVEGQSRTFALNDEANRRKIGANLELQNIQNAHEAAVTNANNQASRAINSAKDIEGFINNTLNTGLDIYKQQRENRINQEKRDLAGIALKYGLSATDMAGLRGMTNEMIHDDGVQEGLGFKLRGYGMSTAEMLQVNGASKLAHAAVAINTGTLQYKNLASSVLLSQELVPGFNKTPAQLIEDGSPEAQAALRAEFNRMGAEIQVSLEKLGIQNDEPFFKAYYGSKAEFESLLSKSSEAHANQKEDIAANQKIQWAHNNSEGGVLNFVSKEMGGAHAGGGGPAAIAVAKKYIGVIGQQIEQGILPIWLADELPNMKIPGTPFTLGTHGAYGPDLLEVKKAARRHITGEHTDRRREAEAAQWEWEENLGEFANQSKKDMVDIMATTRKHLLKQESEGISTNWQQKMAAMEAIYNKTPTIRTPTQKLFQAKVNQDNGSSALLTHAEVRQTFQTPKEQNDALSKLMKDRHTYNTRVLNPQIERLANPLMKQGSPEFKAHWTVGWMKQDATKRFWADATRYRMQGMSPEDAKAKALATLATDFKVAEDNQFTGHYAILDVNKSGGKVGFAGAWKEWGEAQSVGGGVGNTYREIVDIFDNNTLKEADLSNWEITADQLKDQLNPNTPNSTFVMGRVTQAMRLAEYKGGMNDAMVELITNSTGQPYTPPAQTRQMSDAARAVSNRLIDLSLSDEAVTYSVRGSGGSGGSGVRHAQGHITYESNPGLYQNFGRRIQAMGFKVAEHIDFGGVAPGVHSPTGYHPVNEGFDITHQTGDYNTSIEYTRRFKEAMTQLGALNQVLGPGDSGHDTHTDLGGIRFMPTEEQWRWVENYVFGGNQSQQQQPNKLDTPVTYGDTSVTNSSGNTFTLGPVTEGPDPINKTVEWLAGLNNTEQGKSYANEDDPEISGQVMETRGGIKYWWAGDPPEFYVKTPGGKPEKKPAHHFELYAEDT